jgi:hypothetical protein
MMLAGLAVMGWSATRRRPANRRGLGPHWAARLLVP